MVIIQSPLFDKEGLMQILLDKSPLDPHFPKGGEHSEGGGLNIHKLLLIFSALVIIPAKVNLV